MSIDYEKATRYTIAGICGVIGFAITYVFLGWALQPIENWINNNLVRGMK